MGHVAKDCRADKKVEGATNLALEDITNEGLLLMAQNEDNINKRYSVVPRLRGKQPYVRSRVPIQRDAKHWGWSCVIWRWIKGGGQRPRYDTFLTKGWFNMVNLRCLLRTRPQDQHIEYGATHRERLLNILKRLPATPKGQARAFGYSSRDRKKSDVQTEFKKHTRKLFASQRRRQGITMASPLWSPTSWRPKRVSKEEYGAWATQHGFWRKILWRMRA